MEEQHKYRVVAWWTSGRTGTAKSDSAPNSIHFTAPPEFGGLEGRWTPEDLLLGAVASCFTTTFRVIAEYAKFEYSDLEVEAEGIVRKIDSGYSFSEILLRPTLMISSEQDQGRALGLLRVKLRHCVWSRVHWQLRRSSKCACRSASFCQSDDHRGNKIPPKRGMVSTSQMPS